jgi:hypothetical protein
MTAESTCVFRETAQHFQVRVGHNDPIVDDVPPATIWFARMRLEIFVGSSSESLPLAKQVTSVLSRVAHVHCVDWPTIFHPGSVTFEALEGMLLRCCGAVFVASADDHNVIRGHDVRSPRANVMLEFGLVAGRMGRENIAICQFGDVALPSDLNGMTVIPMDAPVEAGDDAGFRKSAEQKLRLWASRLLATADRIPRTEVVHGYTGRWELNVQLHMWRDLVVKKPGYVYIKGKLDLLMPSSGQTGRGLAHGHLRFLLPDGESNYEGEYLTAHEITGAFCEKDGSLQFSTEAFAVQRMRATGQPPPQLANMDVSPEPWTARWRLSPCADPLALRGEVHTQGDIISKGEVLATKMDRDV